MARKHNVVDHAAHVRAHEQMLAGGRGVRLSVILSPAHAKAVSDRAWDRRMTISRWLREIVERELKVKP